METKSLMQALRPEIDAALAEIAKKHNLQKLELARGTFSREGSFTWKLEGVAAGGIDKDAERYKTCREMFNLPPLGTEVTLSGKTFTISGINTTASKIKINRKVDGKGFVAPLDVIQRVCGAKVAA